MNNASNSYSFITRRGENFTDLNDMASIDLAFIGVQVDDRGTKSIDLLKSWLVASQIKIVTYLANENRLKIDDEYVSRAQLKTLLNHATRIILDATTLGVGEILQILLAAQLIGKSAIEFLYLEPKLYSEQDPANIIHRGKRDFQLTKNCTFRGIQGFMHEYQQGDKATHVFMLGFEPWRVQNAVEQRNVEDNLKSYKCLAVVGTPAFRAGWESNTLIPHLAFFESLDISSRSITYCQANSIRESYLALWELYKQLGNEYGCFYISPLGTKPHAIGAALFLLETKGNDYVTSLYYDHPERVSNRSIDYSAWQHVKVMLKPVHDIE